MRLAVIADIHGNYRALEAVLDDLEGQRVDRVVSLGDNVGYGPEPEQVVTALTSAGIFSVMGNHELALFDKGYLKRLNPVSQESLSITRSLLSKQSIDWLAANPPTAVVGQMRLVHGCPPASVTAYLYNPSAERLARIFSSFCEPICCCGHTHSLDGFSLDPAGEIVHDALYPGSIAMSRENRFIIIPGSIGQPRDHCDQRAKYGIWDEECSTFEIRAVDYDVKTTVRLLEELGFPLSNARRLL